MLLQSNWSVFQMKLLKSVERHPTILPIWVGNSETFLFSLFLFVCYPSAFSSTKQDKKQHSTGRLGNSKSLKIQNIQTTSKKFRRKSTTPKLKSVLRWKYLLFFQEKVLLGGGKYFHCSTTLCHSTSHKHVFVVPIHITAQNLERELEIHPAFLSTSASLI